MLTFGPNTRIFVGLDPVDMRGSFGDSHQDGVPMFSIEVVETGSVYYNLEEVAFKVDSLGRPVPKTSKASGYMNPYSLSQGLFLEYEGHLMNLGHHKLRW